MTDTSNYTGKYAKRQSRKQPLGSNAVFAVSPKIDGSTGEPESARKQSTRLRFELQEAAQYLMRNEAAGKRLRACMVLAASNPNRDCPEGVPFDSVQVDLDTHTGKGRYTNLQHCDSPWLCPVCCHKIGERDKKEVNLAYMAAIKKGYFAVMVTYTQRHTKADSLAFLLDVNAQARRWMKSNSRIDGITWGHLKRKYGMVGGIINLECTYGKNAWHPHNHELIFCDPNQADCKNLDEMYEDFSERWQYAVRQYGGDCDKAHGVDIKSGDEAVAEYIAKIGREPRGKWSIAAEMTKGASKRGRKEGRTPQDLLFDYKYEGDAQAGALFVEFGREFAGKAHIRWSQGLRELLDMDNFEAGMSENDPRKPDYESEDWIPFCAVPKEAWYQVICAKFGRRIEFLFACEQGAIEVTELLSKWNYKSNIHWITTTNKSP